MKKIAAIFGVLLLSSAMLVGCGGNKQVAAPATDVTAPAADEAKDAPAADESKDAPAADAQTGAPAEEAPAAN